ncbi:MAG: citrate synthase [Oscillospiraceae bacterium]|nr:citrate synthase [Oscillospiraceae bacterium]
MTDLNKTAILHEYVNSFCGDLKDSYAIDYSKFNQYNLKRGLRNSDGTGVLAGITRVGSVQGYLVEDGAPLPIPGKLYYRGYDVEEIVSAHAKSQTFGYEEVAYLLLMGSLPTADQLRKFDTVLSAARILPDGFTEDMIIKAPSRNIMNKLARGVLALYSYDDDPDDISVENLMRQSIELIGRFPVIVANAYAVKRHYYDGKSLYIHVPRENLSVSENFLRIVRQDKSYTREEALLLDIMLMLHAEHGGGNNSAFTCRVLSSSGTDTYSAIAGAVSSLKGPLHGGAAKKVKDMFYDLKATVRDYEDDDEVAFYLNRLIDGDVFDGAGKIYGLGHAVYTVSDPRAVMLKKYAKGMAEEKGRSDDFRLMETIERLGIPILRERKKIALPVCANVDMYSGLVYSMLGIPDDLLTPLFAIARISGWCAHRIEEVLTGGRIMRPAYRAAMVKSPYVPIDERG